MYSTMILTLNPPLTPPKTRRKWGYDLLLHFFYSWTLSLLKKESPRYTVRRRERVPAKYQISFLYERHNITMWNNLLTITVHRLDPLLLWLHSQHNISSKKYFHIHKRRIFQLYLRSRDHKWISSPSTSLTKWLLFSWLLLFGAEGVGGKDSFFEVDRDFLGLFFKSIASSLTNSRKKNGLEFLQSW